VLIKFSYCKKKKANRIVTNSRPKESCRYLFKNSKIMTFFSQYIYSLVLFTLIIIIYLILTMRFTATKLEPTVIYIYLQLT
jgi:hypothetical protein